MLLAKHASSTSWLGLRLVHILPSQSRAWNQEWPLPVDFSAPESFLPWRDMTSNVNVPFSNPRAVVILIVAAFHSALPYLASQPEQPFAFDAEPCRWIAFPIIDHERWFGFDLFCAWQDIALMPLMFFLLACSCRQVLGARALSPISPTGGGASAFPSRWRRQRPFRLPVNVR